MLKQPPLSLYIHIPWCIKKCPYCDFNSHTYSETGLPEQAYIQQLIKDFEGSLGDIYQREIISVFLGGGTPSLFSPSSIHCLLDTLAKLSPFSSDIEITMEANPGTYEQKKFANFRAAGVNRLSLGIQSFQDHLLTSLGRIHSGKESLLAASQARKAGFENINLDLMYGLPGQSYAMAMKDIDMAVSIDVEHISWYQLTIEPNTVFYSFPPLLPEDDMIWDMQQGGSSKMELAGFKKYEISAWSQPNKQSVHNLNYWTFGDYIGIGAGAHGKITDIHHHHIIRKQKTRMPEAYLKKSMPGHVEEKKINKQDLPLEFFLNTMRLTEGVPVSDFQDYTGLSLSTIEKKIEMLRKKKWLASHTHLLQPTELGQRFLNDLLLCFMDG